MIFFIKDNPCLQPNLGYQCVWRQCVGIGSIYRANLRFILCIARFKNGKNEVFYLLAHNGLR